MKELNELVDQAKEISSKQWFLNADEEVTAVDNDAGPDDSEEAFIGCAANIQLAKYMATASPETILAIAEAYRALEQRAEAAEAKLAELERQEPIFQVEVSGNHWLNAGPVDDTDFTGLPDGINRLYARPAPAINLAELVPDDYFSGLVNKARTSADKAMLKFPQPNYVLLKVAEEAGEVVQAGVHYAENRMTWQELEGEIVQLLAMLIRLVTEGDQVNGITPPEECRAAILRNIEEQSQ